MTTPTPIDPHRVIERCSPFSRPSPYHIAVTRAMVGSPNALTMGEACAYAADQDLARVAIHLREMAEANRTLFSPYMTLMEKAA